MLKDTTRDLKNKFHKAINMNFDKIAMTSNEPEMAKTAFRLIVLFKQRAQKEPNLEEGRPRDKACLYKWLRYTGQHKRIWDEAGIWKKTTTPEQSDFPFYDLPPEYM